MPTDNFKASFWPRGLRFVVIALLSGAAFIAIFGALGFRINLTPSYPMGVWRIQKGVTPKKGDFVMFHLPKENGLYQLASERNYIKGLPQGGFAPMVKKLAAVEGDFVVLADEISINGTPWPNGKILKLDSNGRETATVAKSGIVPPGHFWALSDYNYRSFDSRYFGALPLEAIFATARPVFVFDGEF